jgi:hypothetical protein
MGCNIPSLRNGSTAQWQIPPVQGIEYNQYLLKYIYRLFGSFDIQIYQQNSLIFQESANRVSNSEPLRYAKHFDVKTRHAGYHNVGFWAGTKNIHREKSNKPNHFS